MREEEELLRAEEEELALRAEAQDDVDAMLHRAEDQMLQAERELEAEELAAAQEKITGLSEGIRAESAQVLKMKTEIENRLLEMTKRAETAESSVAQLTLANSVLEAQCKDVKARYEAMEAAKAAADAPTYEVHTRLGEMPDDADMRQHRNADEYRKILTARIEQIDEKLETGSRLLAERLTGR